MGSDGLGEVLHRIESACADGELPLVVFDLDSTLFSTAPRNLRIVRDFASVHGGRRPELLEIARSIGLPDMGWNIQECLRARAVTDADLLRMLRDFWFERFFSDEYLAFDTPVRGAVEFVSACHERGGLIYYLTGRHVGGMESGTRRSLSEKGFPLGHPRCVLRMKPAFEISDRLFKEEAVADIDSHQARVIATFENEPGHANGFARAFPGALHYLLTTIHSAEAEEPCAELIPIPDFALERS